MPNRPRQPNRSRGVGLFFVLFTFASALGASAQLGLPAGPLSRSSSGQFVILPSPGRGASPLLGMLENDTNYIRLDPTLLPISCERIKQILWRELGITTPWKGKIFLRTYAPTSADDPMLIESEQFRDGWQYRVTLPALSHRERYVHAIVSVLLLEFANREASAHSAEIPAWLSEGLARELYCSSQREVLLPPPQTTTGGLRMTTLLVNVRRDNPLEQAHQELCAGTPLTFQQLSWPGPGAFIGEAGRLYRSSAQVFVHQLLATSNGSACARTMLASLPQYYNWQFAFLHAFHDLFQGPLDIEKWWSLQLVHFTGRALEQTWSAEESWEKLDEIVHSAVQIRVGTNELPLRAEVTLQTIIRDWPLEQRTPTLQAKARQLFMLRPRLARDLAGLAEEYARVLDNYLQNLSHGGFVLPFRKHATQRRKTEEALQQIDALDARRATLRPEIKPSAPVPGPPRVVAVP
jgi:hypothetical protein